MSINTEEIVNLGVEVMIIWDYQTDEAEQLEKLEITPVMIKNETIDELQDSFRAIGELLGKEDRAQEFINLYNTTYDYMKSKADDVKKSEKPKVLYLRNQELETQGNDNFMKETLELAGADNVAEAITGSVTMEQILEWNPDIIFLSNFDVFTPDDLYNNTIIAILLGMGSAGVQILAFIGGFIAVFITTSIPKILKNNSMTMLVLAGIIVGGLMNSIMGLIKYVADPETQLASITYWQLGSLTSVTDKDILFIVPSIIISAIVLLILRWRINILSMGDSEAKTLGVDTAKLRGIIIIAATILTASSVCISGTIGWIGLVIPHLGRMIIGPDNEKMLPVSMILGSMFLVFIDLISRTLTTSELPLGILTGLIGAPFYFYLLLKQRRGLN